MNKARFPIIKPFLTEREFQNIKKVLRSGWLTQGCFVGELEEKIKSYHKVKFAFLMNSATSGLIAALAALRLEKNSEVIVPSFTFPATANAVIIAGLKPVFCDIDLGTFNIAGEKLERSITKKTKAIMPVHEFGLSADMDRIMAIAKKYNLAVVEDAACSIGAQYNGKKTGTFGDAGVFSFHPRKIITCGEGGCVITNDSITAKHLDYLRNHGDYHKKFIDYGYNFRLSDIQASMLASQFKNLEARIKQRIKLALNYNRLLGPLDKAGLLKIPFAGKGRQHIYQSYVVLLYKNIGRDKLKNNLRKKGIETQFGTYCVPLVDFYRKNFKISPGCYKNALYASQHSLTLPLYHTLRFNEQIIIVNELKRAIEECAE